jgi:fatty acid desaturase
MSSIAKSSLIEAHRPRWRTFRLWLLFTAVLVTLQAALAWAVWHDRYWLAVPLTLLVAHFMHSQLMAFHEAAHYVFCPNRRLNEAVGIGIGVFHFNSLSLFRAVHHTHHAHLGTIQDEQLWPFVDPGVPRWRRRLAAAAELTLGMFYDAIMFWRAFFRHTTPIRTPQMRRRIRQEFALLVVFWSAMFAATVWLDTAKLLLWMYVIPVLLTGSMYAWRKYVEHMGLMGSTPAGLSRSVIHTDPLGRLLTFTMFNIGFHGVHHAYASLPQDALPQFSGVLHDDEHAAGEAVYPTYYRAFCAMLPSLADPRVGAQWLDTEQKPCAALAPGDSRTAAYAGGE